MDILGVIAAFFFMLFFIVSMKSIVEKSEYFIIYTVFCSIFFSAIFYIFMACMANS